MPTIYDRIHAATPKVSRAVQCKISIPIALIPGAYPSQLVPRSNFRHRTKSTREPRGTDATPQLLDRSLIEEPRNTSSIANAAICLVSTPAPPSVPAIVCEWEIQARAPAKSPTVQETKFRRTLGRHASDAMWASGHPQQATPGIYATRDAVHNANSEKETLLAHIRGGHNAGPWHRALGAGSLSVPKSRSGWRRGRIMTQAVRRVGSPHPPAPRAAFVVSHKFFRTPN